LRVKKQYSIGPLEKRSNRFFKEYITGNLGQYYSSTASKHRNQYSDLSFVIVYSTCVLMYCMWGKWDKQLIKISTKHMLVEATDHLLILSTDRNLYKYPPFPFPHLPV
jgi:hypothetical protein